MNLLKSLLVHSFFLVNCYAFEYQLGVCCIFRDEALYLKEWIEYHRKVGVEHFWLYNNNSTDDFMFVLQDYIAKGVVELIECPSSYEGVQLFDHNAVIEIFNKTQESAYDDAITKSKGVAKWLALIDSDEFLVPVQEETVIECLEKRFNNVAGVGVNWQCYGTSHIANLDPNKLMIEQLVMKKK